MRDGFDARNFNASRPKLSAFDEQKDDMDAYLERYEWFVTRKWTTGLQVYSSMPPGDANNYEKLETALLQQFELTQYGFHRKFRENKPEVGEQCFSCSTAEKTFHKFD